MNNNMSYEEYLSKYGTMTYKFKGVSMLPLLRQGKDLYTVVKKTNERNRKYDVVLYRKKPDMYVLHRIIQVREDDYVILGDNCVTKEYGIKDSDILAVMTEYIRNGKIYSVDTLPYKIYSVLWVNSYTLRMIYRRVKRKLRSIINK